jgi:flagellar hook protein FlgE
MGLFGAMTASVSGLNSQGEAISVISDNLSNANTIGFKVNRALFSQLVTTSGTGGGTFNAGGALSNIQRAQNTQGSIISTTSATDLSLSGNGFFRVSDAATINTDTGFFFTRAGAFTENKDGFLVTPSGNYLQGWQTDSSGNIIDQQNPTSIELQSVGVSAQATSSVSLGLNLTSTQANNNNYTTASALTATGVNLNSFVATPTLADFVTDVRVFDAQGGARDLSVAFSKRAANFWDFTVYTDGSNLEGGTANVNTRISNGTLRFNTDGSLKDSTGTSFTADWANGVVDGSLTMDFGNFTGGSVVSSTTNLDFTDGVFDIAVEDVPAVTATTAPAGTYTLELTAANTYRLTDSLGDTSTVTVTGAAKQELLFKFSTTRTYETRMTVDTSFPVTAGSYPNTVGTFVVGNQAAQGDGSGTNGALQFAASFNTSFVNQNGFGSGNLSDIQVDQEGFISGTFTNGETKKLWKIVVAVFQNPNALETVSGSLLRVTDESGQALLKEAGVGSTASVVAGTLESSTVDIANEFSQMIVAQRSFQANSTVISTVDQMLNELLQLR